jgi:N-carbamoyl-L-amino-acid hydrolase
MQFCKKVYDILDMHWKSDSEGIFRPAYSQEETDAIKVIEREALQLGMEIYQDLAGNIYFIYPGKDRYSPVFLTGSHLDSVPKGGKWDGTAGIVGALAAIKTMAENQVVPDVDIVLVVMRAEESAWFGSALLGSKMACGQVGSEILGYKRFDTQKSLGEYLEGMGLNVVKLKDKLDHRSPLIPISRIDKFVEVHIEQGSSLISSGVDLGIVTDIRGNVRFPQMISFFGKASHTGGTPQADRIDASLAAAYYQVELDKIFTEIQEKHDIVWAFPQGGVVGGSSTTVPAQFDIRPEVRSIDARVLGMAKEAFTGVAIGLKDKRRISIGDNINRIDVQDPAPLNATLLNWIERHAISEQLVTMRTISGSGHDAVSFSKAQIPTGLIFIPHGLDGLSHNPKEIITKHPTEDPFSVSGSFNKAVTLMTRLMMETTSNGNISRHTFPEHLQECGAHCVSLG